MNDATLTTTLQSKLKKFRVQDATNWLAKLLPRMSFERADSHQQSYHLRRQIHHSTVEHDIDLSNLNMSDPVGCACVETLQLALSASSGKNTNNHSPNHQRPTSTSPSKQRRNARTPSMWNIHNNSSKRSSSAFDRGSHALRDDDHDDNSGGISSIHLPTYFVTLRLNKNNLTGAICPSIVALLGATSRLRSLDLTENNLSVDAIHTLTNTIHSLVLRPNLFVDSTAMLLAANRNHNNNNNNSVNVTTHSANNTSQLARGNGNSNVQGYNPYLIDGKGRGANIGNNNGDHFYDEEGMININDVSNISASSTTNYHNNRRQQQQQQQTQPRSSSSGMVTFAAAGPRNLVENNNPPTYDLQAMKANRDALFAADGDDSQYHYNNNNNNTKSRPISPTPLNHLRVTVGGNGNNNNNKNVTNISHNTHSRPPMMGEDQNNTSIVSAPAATIRFPGSTEKQQQQQPNDNHNSQYSLNHPNQISSSPTRPAREHLIAHYLVSPSPNLQQPFIQRSVVGVRQGNFSAPPQQQQQQPQTSSRPSSPSKSPRRSERHDTASNPSVSHALRGGSNAEEDISEIEKFVAPLTTDDVYSSTNNNNNNNDNNTRTDSPSREDSSDNNNSKKKHRAPPENHVPQLQESNSKVSPYARKNKNHTSSRRSPSTASSNHEQQRRLSSPREGDDAVDENDQNDDHDDNHHSLSYAEIHRKKHASSPSPKKRDQNLEHEHDAEKIEENEPESNNNRKSSAIKQVLVYSGPRIHNTNRGATTPNTSKVSSKHSNNNDLTGSYEARHQFQNNNSNNNQHQHHDTTSTSSSTSIANYHNNSSYIFPKKQHPTTGAALPDMVSPTQILTSTSSGAPNNSYNNNNQHQQQTHLIGGPYVDVLDFLDISIGMPHLHFSSKRNRRHQDPEQIHDNDDDDDDENNNETSDDDLFHRGGRRSNNKHWLRAKSLTLLSESNRSGMFRNLTLLEIIGLGLLSLPPNLPPGLLRLDISRNEIESLDNLVDSCPHLQVLNARRNKLTDIGHHTFSKCPEITHLFLGRNKIPYVEGLSHLLKLETLDLSFNSLSMEDDIRPLSQNVGLKHLFLEGNPFQIKASRTAVVKNNSNNNQISVNSASSSRYRVVVRNFIPHLLSLDNNVLSVSRQTALKAIQQQQIDQHYNSTTASRTAPQQQQQQQTSTPAVRSGRKIKPEELFDRDRGGHLPATMQVTPNRNSQPQQPQPQQQQKSFATSASPASTKNRPASSSSNNNSIQKTHNNNNNLSSGNSSMTSPEPRDQAPRPWSSNRQRALIEKQNQNQKNNDIFNKEKEEKEECQGQEPEEHIPSSSYQVRPAPLASDAAEYFNGNDDDEDGDDDHAHEMSAISSNNNRNNNLSSNKYQSPSTADDVDVGTRTERRGSSTTSGTNKRLQSPAFFGESSQNNNNQNTRNNQSNNNNNNTSTSSISHSFMDAEDTNLPQEVQTFSHQLSNDLDAASVALRTYIVVLGSKPGDSVEGRQCIGVVKRSGLLMDTVLPKKVVRYFQWTEDELNVAPNAAEDTSMVDSFGGGGSGNVSGVSSLGATMRQRLLKQIHRLNDAKTCLRYITSLAEAGPGQEALLKVFIKRVGKTMQQP